MLFGIVFIGFIIVLMSMFAVSFSIDTKNVNYVAAFCDALIVLLGFVFLMFTIIPLCIGG